MTQIQANERKRMPKSLAGLATALVLGVLIAACGGDDSDDSGDKAGTPATGEKGKQGGSVTVMSAGDIDKLDPGYWYYQYDYMALGQTTQRQLYSYAPEDIEQPTPDVAEDYPKVSAGGKTLTIKIKQGIKYSPPLQDRAVTAADVKYAMERIFQPRVANAYAGAYFGAIDGVKEYQSGKADEVSGIEAPDDETLVIKLVRPQGVLATGAALALPGTVPVPKDYAAKYDKGSQSTYGEHQVFTGPYMVANDGKGNVTGYQAGKKIELVRNPSWDKESDFRPAYLDKITFSGGNDTTVASRQVLSGKGLVNGDFAAPPTAILKSALASQKDQLLIEPGSSIRYIALNSKVKPFDNENVRKALAAVINKNDLRTTRGGPALGTIATHWIPPGVPGFDESGGEAGPEGLDFNQNPEGDLELATEYMKKGGFPTGKYTGPALLMIGDNEAPASKTGEAIQAQLEQLGFKFTYRQVQHATAASKFCGVPKSETAICPNLAWGKDFNDAQSMITPIFHGKNIVPAGNVNVAQLNDPKLNAEMDKAEELNDPAERAAAWAELNKQITAGAWMVPWLWDNQVNFASADVNGVRSNFNSSWDLSFTSLK